MFVRNTQVGVVGNVCVCVHHRVLYFPFIFYYLERHSKSLFVLSRYGGHLGFFEGGFVFPRSETWLDRLVVEFAEACLVN